MNIEHPAVLIVVELQNDLCAPSLADSNGLAGALARAVRDRAVLTNLARVLERWRSQDLPVMYATKERHPDAEQPTNAPIYAAGGSKAILVTGTWGAQIVDEIAPRDGDVVIARFTSIDPSYGSTLWDELESLKARTIVVAGISTNFAVEGLVRAAANRGYKVVVLEDCCASVPDGWHRFSADNILPLLAEVIQSSELLSG